MNNKLSILIMVLAVFMTACTKDPFKDLEKDNSWQKERNLVSILIEGQMGTAVVEREFDDAKVKVYAKLENIANISSVEVKDIQLAYGASSSIMAGSTLDFSSGQAIVPVVSGAGETLNWEITLLPFISDLEGTWYIKGIDAYCDFFTWESWGWTEYINIIDLLPESSPELDDVITFTVEGADESGNPYGNYSHAPGNDGIYGSFSDSGKGWDFNERYRKMPKGEGTWMRDFEQNKVFVTVSGIDYVFDLELIVETSEAVMKTPIPYQPELFNWSDTDWGYEKVAHMSNPMWYKLTRERIVQTGNDIKSFAVENQVGDAEINNDAKEITVVIPDNGADLSAIKITNLGVSYGANVNKAVDEMLDFSSGNMVQIIVTSEAGEEAVWNIKLQIEVDPSQVTIAGTWTISEIGMYCDLFTWESWGWDKYAKITDYMSAVNGELDNTITFTVDGKNAQDQLYGNYENNAGTDGLYANFVSDDANWPETDFNNRFRKIPTGTGTWVQEDNMLVITDSESNVYNITLEIKTENEIGLTSELDYLAELFDWNVQNYSYEEVAHMSKKMWYNLNRQ